MMIKGMKVRCINNSGEGLPINPSDVLVVGNVYTVVGENGYSNGTTTDYFLEGVESSWRKDRFVLVNPSKIKRYTISRAVLSERLGDAIRRLGSFNLHDYNSAAQLSSIFNSLSDVWDNLLTEKK